MVHGAPRFASKLKVKKTNATSALSSAAMVKATEENEEIESLFATKSGVTDFDKLVYKATMAIPSGKVATYGYIASKVKNPKAFRAVGSALRRNPFAPKVPCHRVIAANRSLGGFYGSTDPQGQLLKSKLSMLISEGVQVENYNESSIAASSNSNGRKDCSNVSKIKVHSSCILE